MCHRWIVSECPPRKSPQPRHVPLAGIEPSQRADGLSSEPSRLGLIPSSLFPSERLLPEEQGLLVQIKLSKFQPRTPSPHPAPSPGWATRSMKQSSLPPGLTIQRERQTRPGSGDPEWAGLGWRSPGQAADPALEVKEGFQEEGMPKLKPKG